MGTMRASKKGIELSVNFIVMVILGLVLFAMGLYLLSQAINVGKEMTDVIDDQHKKEIESLLMQGEKVTIPFDRVNLHVGEHNVFGLGILNEIDGAPMTFTVTLSPGVAVDSLGKTIPGPLTNKVALPFTSKDYTIRHNDQEIISLPVKILKGAPRGTYTVHVKVECDPDCGGTPPVTQYDTTKIIYLDVI